MRSVLFLVTEDWYFVSHRLQLALALRERGWSVRVAARCTGSEDRLRAAGIEVVPLEWRRRGTGWGAEVRTFRALRQLLHREPPSVLHLVALKPALIGAAAALPVRQTRVVAAIAGLGYVFASGEARARVLRPLVRAALGTVLRRADARVIVQNPEDAEAFVRSRMVRPDRVTLIRGAGVDLAEFSSAPEPPGPVVVLLAGRLLRSKGVPDFVVVASRLRGRARFVLCGEPDGGSPDSVSEAELRAWVATGVVEWWGRRSDMPAVLTGAHVVCLPSVYGEGVPKILLEAAAVGRPLVAYDWPGCREVVRDRVNGRLVAPRDLAALQATIAELIDSVALRLEYGAASRQIAEREFSLESVVDATISVYQRP